MIWWALRHPETWPCDDCGLNYEDVFTMPNGDQLCMECELEWVLEEIRQHKQAKLKREGAQTADRKLWKALP